MSTVTQATIQFSNLLSPLMSDAYEYITNYISISLGYPTTLYTDGSLLDFENGHADVGFMCGLLYVRLTQQEACPVELLAAPILQGERYQGKPVYFSDIVVRNDSHFRSFSDLYDCVWAYNEEASHSGYNLVRYGLQERRKPYDYFGKMVKSGSHLHSLQMVLNGEADATAIDSHVLDLWLRRNARLAPQLRFLDAFGPSSIPPVVVSKYLDPVLKRHLQEALITMHHHPFAAQVLHESLIERFVPVVDNGYDDIRAILACVQQTSSPLLSVQR